MRRPYVARFPGLNAPASLKLKENGQAKKPLTVFSGAECPGLIEAARSLRRLRRPTGSFPGLNAPASLKLDGLPPPQAPFAVFRG